MAHLDAGDRATVPFICDEKGWSNSGLVHSSPVIPVLAIAVDHARTGTIQMNILTAPNPPGRSALEVEAEEVRLPEVKLRAERDGAGQGNINVLQEAKVQGSANSVLLVQNDGSAIVALLEGSDNLLRIVLSGRAARLDKADLFGVTRRGEVNGSVRLVRPGQDLGSDGDLACQNWSWGEGGGEAQNGQSDALSNHDDSDLSTLEDVTTLEKGKGG